MTVQGTWHNAYGSQMVLNASTDGLVLGTYRSTTGSTGQYYVIGWQQPIEPTTTAGQPVALAIDWHSYAGGAGDPSWNWTSGLSGQLTIESTEQQLVVAHAMVASSDFPGLCKAGTYIDKLVYHRVSDLAAEAPEHLSTDTAPVADPLAGTWQSTDGSTILALQVQAQPGNLFGRVSGQVKNAGGSFMVRGMTDINARSSGLTKQSTSIAAQSSDGVVGYAGTLDLNGGLLTLLVLGSVSTAANATYVQTTATQLVFRRVAAED